MIKTPHLRIALIVAVIAVVIGTGSMVMILRSRSDSALKRVLSTCDTGSTDHAPCYEAEIPKLYPAFSVPELFEIIRGVRAADPSYQFCHVLAHKIGERVVAEDPDKWIEAIPLNPANGYCSNGFIHGVTGGRFRSDVLSEEQIRTFLPDFRRACEPHDGWDPSDLDKAICYHGIGHLYDFITNADLTRALSLCEQTAPSQFRRVCAEGVFMQIYQPLEPDDFELIKQMKQAPTPATVRRFCASFKDAEYVGACLRESWPLYPGMTDGSGARIYCAGQPNTELEERCYQGAFAIIGRQVLSRPDDQAKACDRVPAERRVMCYSVVADAILEEDRTAADAAVGFCARLGAEAGPCVGYIVQAAGFNFGSDAEAYARLCAAVPEEYRAMCTPITHVFRP